MSSLDWCYMHGLDRYSLISNLKYFNICIHFEIQSVVLGNIRYKTMHMFAIAHINVKW